MLDDCKLKGGVRDTTTKPWDLAALEKSKTGLPDLHRFEKNILYDFLLNNGIHREWAGPLMAWKERCECA